MTITSLFCSPAVGISVKCGTGELLYMEVNTAWTVEQLKRTMDAQFGVPFAVQQLGSAMRGNPWNNGAVLSDCGVRRGCVICLWWAPLRVHLGRTATATAHCETTTTIAGDETSGASSSSSSSSSSLAPTHGRQSLFVFDLDDTLTKNGVMNASTLNCLQNLSKDHKLAIASFNLSAVEFLQKCGCLELFDVVVCGFYAGVSKEDHMGKVLDVLKWPGLDCCGRGPVYFFDDQPVNVEDVRTAYPGTVCLHVRSLESVPLLVESLMSICRASTSPPTTAAPTTALSSSFASPLSPPDMDHVYSTASTPSSAFSSSSCVSSASTVVAGQASATIIKQEHDNFPDMDDCENIEEEEEEDGEEEEDNNDDENCACIAGCTIPLPPRKSIDQRKSETCKCDITTDFATATLLSRSRV